MGWVLCIQILPASHGSGFSTFRYYLLAMGWVLCIQILPASHGSGFCQALCIQILPASHGSGLSLRFVHSDITC